jgi:Phytanoyl-CoA dioxygenase (PhyH)
MNGPTLDADLRQRWHTDGWCVVEDLFPVEEIAAAQQDLAELFPDPEAVAARLRDGGRGDLDLRWDATKPVFPFEGMALNRLVVHDRLIDLAQELLGVDQVRLYQGMASAKYSDGHPDYEQLLHVDYGNHTLVVPRADRGYQHLELFVYLSDVTPETAATRVVSRRLTRDIPVERMYLHLGEYASLYESEESASGPAGSVLAYRSDVYHRGTSLSAEGAARFLLHVAYKPVDTDWLGYHTWPVHGEGRPWNRFVPQASPRQLSVLGFPEPGHPYWNEETLRGVAGRYPHLDMTPWRQAVPGKEGTTR